MPRRKARKGRSRKVAMRLAKASEGGHGNRLARAGRIRRERKEFKQFKQWRRRGLSMTIIDGEHLSEDDCVDAEGNVYPEHDYPEDAGTCRRCDAEPDEPEDAETDEDEFSDAVRRKARQLISGGCVRRDSERQGIWWVRSQTSETKDEYRVELNEYGFQSCSCKHGLNKGGGTARCSHVLAAYLTSKYEL